MALLLGLLLPLRLWNDVVLAAGRIGAILALALMVLAILVQVFFRYVLDNALPWPDEAARFMMLWMTGLMAPLAYRRGGFVAIDMLENALPRRAGALLSLLLLALSLLVLIVAVQIGWKHVNSGWLFASSSLRLPLQLVGMATVKIKLAWMYMSLFVGMVLLSVVNVELMIRALVTVLGGAQRLPPLAETELPGNE